MRLASSTRFTTSRDIQTTGVLEMQSYRVSIQGIGFRRQRCHRFAKDRRTHRIASCRLCMLDSLSGLRLFLTIINFGEAVWTLRAVFRLHRIHMALAKAVVVRD